MSGYGSKKPSKGGYGSIKASPMMSPTKTAKKPRTGGKSGKAGKAC